MLQEYFKVGTVILTFMKKQNWCISKILTLWKNNIFIWLLYVNPEDIPLDYTTS